MSPQLLRRLRLEALEPRTPATAFGVLGSAFGDMAQVGWSSQSMGVNYADYSLVSDPNGGGGFFL